MVDANFGLEIPSIYHAILSISFLFAIVDVFDLQLDPLAFPRYPRLFSYRP